MRAIGNVAGNVAGRGVEFARSRLSQAQLSLADIFEALDATSSLVPTNEVVPFSQELSLPGLEDRVGMGNRASTPTRKRYRAKTPDPMPAAKPEAKPEISFETANEWLQHSKTKGALVEQIYQRSGWRHMLRVTGSADLRKKACEAEQFGTRPTDREIRSSINGLWLPPWRP